MHAFRLALLLGFFLCCLSPLARAADAAWPGVEYATVRAYFYRVDSRAPESIIVEGNLNNSVEQVATLTPEPIKMASAAVEVPPKVETRGLCFEPHHALVYFDAGGKPVAWANICLSCLVTHAKPRISKDRRWNHAKLAALLKSAGLPVPGEAGFEVLLKRRRELDREQDDRTANYNQILANAEFANEAGAPVPPAAAEAAWPWRKFSRVTLHAFDPEKMDGPMVQYGKLQWPSVREVSLTAAQQAELWTAYRMMGAEKLPSGETIHQRWDTGAYEIEDPKTEEKRPWKIAAPDPRFALVCYDEQEAPVAWLQLSFSDLTYTASPPDELLMHFPGIRWSTRRLAELFPKMGISVNEAKPLHKQ